MPRTGGVYSPPAGTKGVPNTTIQSVPYNTLIDDLTADANAARPVTAGGTGATSASGARAALGVEVGTNVQAYDAGLQSIAGLVTVADQMIYTTALDAYATTALTPFARSILDDANAAAVKATLGLAAIASSGSASDITTGTLADARLPTSMSSKTFVNTVTIANPGSNSGLEMGRTDGTANTPFIDLHSSGFANDYDVRLIASGGTSGSGGGTLTLQAASLAIGPAIYQTDGNIQFAGGMVGAVGFTTLANALVAKANLGGANFTGDIAFPSAYATSGAFYVDSAGNRHLWFRSNVGTPRGVLYHDNAAEALIFRLYNTSGVSIRDLQLHQSGTITWGGATVWTSANDGAGSGLDADLLDGSNGTFYADIPARLGYTPVRQGGGSGMGSNSVLLGLGAGTKLLAQIDAVPLGAVWTDNQGGGSVPAGWTKFPNGMVIQASIGVFAVNGSGDGTVVFPSAFPNACVSVVAMMGDAALAVYNLKTFSPISTTGFSFRTTVVSTSVRVNWIAIGY